MSSHPSKREQVLALLEDRKLGRVPAAFFLHFDPAHHRGDSAVRKHLEYFRATDMDIVKIQYEHPFPARPELGSPADWKRIPVYGREFFQDPLDVVAGLVKETRRQALVVVTLYSAFMFAGQLSGAQTLVRHLEEDPESVARGLDMVTKSMLAFIDGCIERGVDGFYASTQGGEAGRFRNPDIFTRYIRPADLAVWKVIHERCPFNILHVCDYHMPYASLEPFRDYPGQMVSTGLTLAKGSITAREVQRLFGRPFLGGMDRHGILGTGTVDQARDAARAALADAPERFMLGADCTLPPTTPWANLRAAVDTAHGAR